MSGDGGGCGEVVVEEGDELSEGSSHRPAAPPGGQQRRHPLCSRPSHRTHRRAAEHSPLSVTGALPTYGCTWPGGEGQSSRCVQGKGMRTVQYTVLYCAVRRDAAADGQRSANGAPEV